MKKLICDRCGKTVPQPPSWGAIDIREVHYHITKSMKQYSPFTWTDVDLCPKCMAEFDDWLKGENQNERSEK